MYIINDDKRCHIVSYHSTQNRILIADSGEKALLNWFFAQYIWEVQFIGLLDDRDIAHKSLTGKLFSKTSAYNFHSLM